MPDFVKVASVDQIPPGEVLTVEVNGKEVCLANVDGTIYAIGNECTHQGGPLGEGVLMGDTVECPWHAGQFNVKSGQVVSPPPSDPVPTYQVQVDGNDVKVAAP
jgi:nitrite reductase (NADH) small subunit/3-phenylpropionate/trans-cinnamate dioxygenase ferredoxin subunit